MTDSGQASQTPPNQQLPDVPDGALAASTSAPEPAVATPPPAEATPPPAPLSGAVGVTMRLPTRPAPEPPPPGQANTAPAAAPPGTPQPQGSPAAPQALDPTMRLIPIPSPPVTTPPPPYPPVSASTPPATYPPAPPSERQIGKYRIKGELGRGGMGAVYLAEQPGLGREVAIKELILSPAADPTALMRFLQEARVMARTSHPNLVQVHDLEQIGDANYIVLEYVRGKSLRDMVSQGPIPMPQTFAVMHGVLQALDYAHRHAIVHRDMKPENVLISDEGSVKVADFGIARLTDDTGAGSTATKTGTTVGTPQYMSPEQVASSKVDGRSDLYSAGIVFYELVVGQPPFTGSESDGPFTLMAKHVQAPPQPPSVRRPGLDMRLEEVILKSLSKRPEERYQTGQEFDEAMSRIADRLCPGWQRSLEPGADLSKMVPATAQAAAMASPGAMPVMAGGVPLAQPAAGAPVQAAYNPAPPVRPVAKKATGCMGILVGAVALTPALCLLVAASVH